MAVTLIFYKGLSENQGRVAGGERQISDKQTAGDGLLMKPLHDCNNNMLQYDLVMFRHSNVVGNNLGTCTCTKKISTYTDYFN